MNLIRIPFLLLLALIVFEQSAYGCINNKNGTLTATDGTVWQVCRFGQTYQNEKCIGEAKQISWQAAMLSAKNERNLDAQNWMLPNSQQSVNLFEKDENCKILHQLIIKVIVSGFKKYPNVFWTSDRSSYGIQTIHTGTYGSLKTLNGTPETDEEPEILFVQGSHDSYQKFMETLNAVESTILREKTEREEYQKRLAAEEEKFQSILNNKNPQVMYLAAGTYYRQGIQNKSALLYEKIISRFPDSQWAVKASDQLSGNRTANNNQRQSHGICEAQKRTCVASCPVRRYSDGSIMMSEPLCKDRCESVSCY